MTILGKRDGRLSVSIAAVFVGLLALFVFCAKAEAQYWSACKSESKIQKEAIVSDVFEMPRSHQDMEVIRDRFAEAVQELTTGLRSGSQDCHLLDLSPERVQARLNGMITRWKRRGYTIHFLDAQAQPRRLWKGRAKAQEEAEGEEWRREEEESRRQEEEERQAAQRRDAEEEERQAAQRRDAEEEERQAAQRRDAEEEERQAAQRRDAEEEERQAAQRRDAQEEASEFRGLALTVERTPEQREKDKKEREERRREEEESIRLEEEERQAAQRRDAREAQEAEDRRIEESKVRVLESDCSCIAIEDNGEHLCMDGFVSAPSSDPDSKPLCDIFRKKP